MKGKSVEIEQVKSIGSNNSTQSKSKLKWIGRVKHKQSKDEQERLRSIFRGKMSAQQIINICHFASMENTNFLNLLECLSKGDCFMAAIHEANQRYLIKSYKISEFNPIIVSQLYTLLQQKFYLRRTRPNQDSWFQNQLRIFVWLLVGYSHVHGKDIATMDSNDWDYFVPIFNHRSPVFFEYQSISLLRRPQKSPKWSSQEAAHLQQIIHSKDYQNKWNSIARELYLRSHRRFYRNPKQCRQHWINHLDPLRLRSSWSVHQDLTLMSTVTTHGKKWSLVVRKLKNTRTEHMVKNRYKSLIANQMKKQPKLKSSQIEDYIIKRLQNSPQEQQMEPQKQGNTIGNIIVENVQQRKSPKPSLRKGSHCSQQPSELADFPEMMELSQSDFLNSPLPIRWLMGLEQEQDSVL